MRRRVAAAEASRTFETGAVQCTPCLSGKWNPNSGIVALTDSCDLCIGQVVRDASNMATQCENCPAGFHNSVNDIDGCDPCAQRGGQVQFDFQSRRVSCEPCPVGHCHLDSSVPQDDCQMCLGRAVQRSSDGFVSSFSLCAVARYNDGVQDSCKFCAGNVVVEAMLQVGCEACPRGSYNDGSANLCQAGWTV